MTDEVQGFSLRAFIKPDEDDRYADLLLLEPREMYDQCILGVVDRFNDRFVLYSRACIIESLTDEGVREGQDYDDAREQAMEHFEFNIIGSWVGDATPAFIEDYF
jgi:hypothetical protein